MAYRQQLAHTQAYSTEAHTTPSPSPWLHGPQPSNPSYPTNRGQTSHLGGRNEYSNEGYTLGDGYRRVLTPNGLSLHAQARNTGGAEGRLSYAEEMGFLGNNQGVGAGYTAGQQLPGSQSYFNGMPTSSHHLGTLNSSPSDPIPSRNLGVETTPSPFSGLPERTLLPSQVTSTNTSSKIYPVNEWINKNTQDSIGGQYRSASLSQNLPIQFATGNPSSNSITQNKERQVLQLKTDRQFPYASHHQVFPDSRPIHPLSEATKAERARIDREALERELEETEAMAEEFFEEDDEEGVSDWRLAEEDARTLGQIAFLSYDRNRSGFLNSVEAGELITELYRSLSIDHPSDRLQGLDFMVANDINTDERYI